MKRTLTALTVAATMFASGVSAFDINTTYEEEMRMQGFRMVGDLSVGVKALISSYTTGCEINGELNLMSIDVLETDPSSYFNYYEIIKEVDGEFTLTYGPAGNLSKKMPDRTRGGKCDAWEEIYPGITFYPVKSINGFTDRRSFLNDLINQGYKP